MNTTESGIHKTNQAFIDAMAKGDAGGVASCYTEDAEFMAPGAPSICGRINIKEAMEGFISEGFTEYAVTSTIVYGHEGIVGVEGAYTLSKAKGVNKDIGKTIQLWKKEDGAWKIFRDCFNSNLATS